MKDKRKSLRRPIRYAAWVVLEDKELHGCSLSDISTSGARLDIDDSKTIPDSFTLLLTSNGAARRHCRVVWRKPRQIGVTFERLTSDDGKRAADRATLVPKADAGAEPAEVVKVEAAPAESK